MQYVPKDPAFKTKIQESFNRQEFMKFLKGELLKIEPGYCEIQLAYDRRLTQQHGFFHAGVISTIADNAAGYAAFSLMDMSSSILTVEFKLNLISPADGELLIGKSNVLKYGKTLTVCRSDIFIIKNGIAKLCAASQSTLIELPNHADH